MKKLLAGVAALFGAGASAAAEPPVQMVDPVSLLFSMPTISADAAPLIEISRTTPRDAPVFHEDEWRQIEFYPGHRSAELRAALTELHSFERANRAGRSGWKQIYQRRIAAEPVIVGDGGLDRLAATLSVPLGPAPVLYYGDMNPVGQVRNGFSMRLGEGAILYGYRDGETVMVLGAYLAGADDFLLTSAFMKLAVAHGLVVVDWRSQMLLEGVAANGDIEVWSPGR